MVTEIEATAQDGSSVVALTVMSPLRDSAGELVGVLSSGRDVSDLGETRGELKRQIEVNEPYRTVMESLPDMVYAKAADGTYTLKNKGFEAFELYLAGLPATERDYVIGQLEAIEQRSPTGVQSASELVLPIPHQGSRVHLATATPIGTLGTATGSGVAVILRDIDDMKALERRLRSEAELDPLTNLANRRAVERCLPGAPSASTVVIMFDLDHFKRINDSYGHGVGDEVIGSTHRAGR